MKRNRIPAIVFILLLSACTTTQEQQAAAILDPIAAAAVAGYAQQFGIPAAVTAPVANAVFGQIWGGIAALQTGQPLAAGTTMPAVAKALDGALPANASTTTKIAKLTAAANSLPVP